MTPRAQRDPEQSPIPDPEHGPTIGDHVRAKIQEGLDSGLDMPAACSETLSWIKREDLAAAVLEEMGATALSYFWRLYEGQKRRQMAIGSRKVEAADLNTEAAILDIHHFVNGKHMRLGDMTADDCTWVARFYRESSGAFLRRADVFTAIGRAVRTHKAKTVREAFAGSRITRLGDLYRKIGDE
jgi:hypothetical protein